MHVDATIEHGGGILADGRRDHGFPTRMILDECGDIVHDASHGDESASVLRLVMVVVPFHDGELVERDAPIELGAFNVDLLLDLLDTTLLDLVGAELLEIEGETELLPRPDGPLGGIVLPPVQCIAVVGGKLVVEVVVAFTERDKGGEDVITGRVAIVKGLITKPVGEGVDAECGLLNEEDSEDASVDEAAQEVVPSKAAEDGGEQEAHEEDDLEVVTVLPDDDWVFIQVTDIDPARTLWVLLHDHPAEVRVEETFADGVGVFVGADSC